ncbi:MAG: serpin family protein [Prevotella sp.]|nr:serpin family protein [Prevotella sp.]
MEEEKKDNTEEVIDDDGDVEKNDSDDVVYMLPRTTPVVLSAAQKVFANDNNSFTLSFLKTMNEAVNSGKGFVCSPLSITYVLAMVNDAASGETEQELEQTLGFHKGGIQAVNGYCKNLIDNLPKVDENVQLTIANAIFLNKIYTLRDQFLKDMKTYYDAKAEALDFSSPATLGYINGWCNEKTQGMIPTILNEVDPDAVSYLLNAIYFKANWMSKFDPSKTKTETFATPTGTKQIPLMHQNVMTGYMKTDDYAAVTMPYGSGLWNMTVLLPEEGKTTDDVISILAKEGWLTDYDKNPLMGYREAEVDLKLPRFETSTDTNDFGSLVGMLKEMGIQQAFNPKKAEILNMCDVPVFISMMRQKAKIEVNEEGSKMAAVTVAQMDATSMAPDEMVKADFHANRPFVYLIHEASSGVILFVGKYTGE